MGLFKRNKRAIERLRARGEGADFRTADVHNRQQLERGEFGEKRGSLGTHIMSLFLSLMFAVAGFIFGIIGFYIMGAIQQLQAGEGIINPDVTLSSILASWKLYAFAGTTFLFAYLIINQRLMRNLRAENAMYETTDINTHENDQHIMLPEEMYEKYEWFPNIGAHSSVQVSSMLSHVMIDKKGLKNVDFVQRYEKDHKTKSGQIIPSGTPKRDREGNIITKNVPIIDEEFGQDLFTASSIPKSDTESRTLVDVRKIPYNPLTKDGSRTDRDKLEYDTVADLINGDWEIPSYEFQRPSGAYLVDSAPVNTMVLAITRAGKGQTVIEPTIDMWTREKRKNNFIANDPKGELMFKFFVPATVRGYEVVQFNLMNPLNTDIYNPLGFAAESAREGDFTKAASYIENIGDIFFPKEGADDPMWPNAANNAFKRSAFGLIDYFLEEEKRIRHEAELKGTPEKVLVQALDDMWGKVSLYNAYQLFVILSAKKSSDPDIIKIDADEEVKEKDYLTLFFDATAKLPQNDMRKLVQNTDNALRAMAGSDKTIASVYGIALTAMSFFTDPTISALTSGKPSQNFDAQGLSFPRRAGVRFASEYVERHKLVGLQAVWSAYADPAFKERLDDKLFGHSQIIDREGWARYYFDGKFEGQKAYLKLEIRNPKKDLSVRSFYFELELMYKTDITGRRYIKDPILDTKIIHNGVLRELRKNRKTGKYERSDTTIRRDYFDLSKPDNEQRKQIIEVPAIKQKFVSYTERPKAVFFITPPHLTSYAKLILILIKQMVDVNFEGSYLTKENQKPLYKTRYMLDEVGNLQSEGKGIPALQTMLSIGLGQDQQFTLILQTLQQLRDVYGENVDRVIQGNTENIVFLKSTDNQMIETLSKMTGTTHRTHRDSKTVTRDNDTGMGGVEGRVSYTISTREEPVIAFNQFMFIPERNSIIIKAGQSPIWNRKSTVYPMSWRLFQNQIRLPGRKFTLQTIPTNSSAKDFDVRKNQPDFFSMLQKRLTQARLVDEYTEKYKNAYGYVDTDLVRLDQNVVADDIMMAINAHLHGFDYSERKTSDINAGEQRSHPTASSIASKVDSTSDIQVDSSVQGLLERSNNNTELEQEVGKVQQGQSEHAKKRYGGGNLSRASFSSYSAEMPFGVNAISMNNADILSRAYAESVQHFEKHSSHYRVNQDTHELTSDTGNVYIQTNKGGDRPDYEHLDKASESPETNVFSDEGDANSFMQYTVTEAFIRHLLTLDDWSDIAGGYFDKEVERAFLHKVN